MIKTLKIAFPLFLVIFSAFLLSGCTVSEERVNEYNTIVSEADTLIETKEYTSAMEKLSTAVDLIPSRVEALKKIVDIFILKNRLEDATKLVDESGSQLNDSDRAALYVLIGDAQYTIGNYERASYNYQIAKSIDSGNKSAMFGIAKSSMQKGKVEEAKDMLKANYTDSMLIESKLLLSYIEALNDHKEAESIVKNVVPGDEWSETYSNWISVLDTLNEDQLFNGSKLGKYYLDEGYPYLAIAILEPKLKDMGEYTDGLYILGKAYFEYGNYDKSIQILENLSTLGDLNQYIYWVLARDYYLKDNVNEATSYYDSAISYGGNKGEQTLYTEYLDILLKENLTEKALEVIKTAERIFDETWVLMYYMRIYSLREDTQKFEYYRDRIIYDGLNDQEKIDYLYLKGEFEINDRELDEAQKTLDTYWGLDPYDPGYNLLSAKLSFEKGELTEARKSAKNAMEYDLNGVISEDAQKLLAQID